tara:strand:+ start:6308 stop:7189 length:882 start_codon:yes stop_codon:yes gene_type:complete
VKDFLTNKIKIINLIIFLSFIFYYISSERQYFYLIRDISLFLAFVILVLFLGKYILNVYLNILLFKNININLNFNEAFKILYFNRVGNSFGFLKIGSGYKLNYLINVKKSNLKDYLGITTLYGLLEYIFNFFIFFLTYSIFGLEKYKIELFLFSSFILLLILFYKRINNFLYNFINEKFEIDLKFNFINFPSLVLITFLNTLINIIIILLIVISVGIDKPIVDVIFYQFSSLLSSIIQITPGNIGFSEVFIYLFNNIHSFTFSEILLISILFRIFNFIFLSFIGIIYKKSIFS